MTRGPRGPGDSSRPGVQTLCVVLLFCLQSARAWTSMDKHGQEVEQSASFSQPASSFTESFYQSSRPSSPPESKAGKQSRT